MRKILPEKLEALLKSFSTRRIIVLGDIMLDEYLWGKVQRISPEAPVPIIEIASTDHRLGGAANAALNLKMLGAEVELAGILGKDAQARTVLNLLKKKKIDTSGIFIDPQRPTTLKTRIGASSQQIVRMDREDLAELSEELQKGIILWLKHAIPRCDAILIEDYDKGLMNEKLICELLSLAAKYHKPVAVDPKFKNFGCYAGVEIFKPNYRELEAYLNICFSSEDEFADAAKALRRKMKIEHLVVTKGSDGMFIFSKGHETKHLPSFARDVFDVSGAGDTVISALTLAYLYGKDIESAALVANHAAAVAVAKKGTASVCSKEIWESFHDLT